MAKAEKVKKGGVQTTALKTFVFPSIGNGIVVKAKNRAEAEEKAAEIRKNLSGGAKEEEPRS